jgi:hypothetical protein
MNRFLPAVVLLLVAASAQAQPISAVNLNIYRQGQTSPAVAPQQIPLTAFVCNQATAPAATATNPGGIAFDDPSAPGRWCHWVAPANGIFSLLAFDATQVYELEAALVNAAGAGPGARASFTRPGTLPAVAPAQLRLTVRP